MTTQPYAVAGSNLHHVHGRYPQDPLSDEADPRSAASPSLHTVQDLARVFKVSTKTIQRRIKDGTIRTVPIGGRLVRISSDELRRLLSGPLMEP